MIQSLRNKIRLGSTRKTAVVGRSSLAAAAAFSLLAVTFGGVTAPAQASAVSDAIAKCNKGITVKYSGDPINIERGSSYIPSYTGYNDSSNNEGPIKALDASGNVKGNSWSFDLVIPDNAKAGDTQVIQFGEPFQHGTFTKELKAADGTKIADVTGVGSNDALIITLTDAAEGMSNVKASMHMPVAYRHIVEAADMQKPENITAKITTCEGDSKVITTAKYSREAYKYAGNMSRKAWVGSAGAPQSFTATVHTKLIEKAGTKYTIRYPVNKFMTPTEINRKVILGDFNDAGFPAKWQRADNSIMDTSYSELIKESGEIIIKGTTKKDNVALDFSALFKPSKGFTDNESANGFDYEVIYSLEDPSGEVYTKTIKQHLNPPKSGGSASGEDKLAKFNLLVWEDKNGNGLIDAGEKGVKDVVVQFFETGNSEETGKTIRTDASGKVTSGDVNPGAGDWHIEIDTPAKYNVYNKVTKDNSFGVNGGMFELKPGDNLDFKIALVTKPEPKIVLKKDYVKIDNGEIFYKVTATNAGNALAKGVVLEDTMELVDKPYPVKYSFHETKHGKIDGHKWIIGDLRQDQTVEATVKAVATSSPGYVRNIVKMVEGPGKTPPATTVNGGVQIGKVVKQKPTIDNPTVIYDISVHNPNEFTARGVSVNDILDNKAFNVGTFHFKSIPDRTNVNGFNWNIGDVGPGETITATVAVDVKPGAAKEATNTVKARTNTHEAGESCKTEGLKKDTDMCEKATVVVPEPEETDPGLPPRELPDDLKEPKEPELPVTGIDGLPALGMAGLMLILGGAYMTSRRTC